MQKLIVFTEEEYNNLFKQFADAFIEQSEKGYGCKLYNNETKKVIKDKNTVYGSLLLPWQRVFK